MNVRATGCCGVQEFTGLSTHTTPEDALLSFCQLLFGASEARRSAWDPPTKGRTTYTLISYLYSFYMFTAAIYPTKPEESQYGHKFAKLIRDNKLGQVSTVR